MLELSLSLFDLFVNSLSIFLFTIVSFLYLSSYTFVFFCLCTSLSKSNISINSVFDLVHSIVVTIDLLVLFNKFADS